MAVERGNKIYSRDWYSSRASDELTRDPNRDFRGLKGWITEFDNNIARTFYIGGEYPAYKVFYEVEFKPNDRSRMVNPSRITNRLIQKFRVREIAMSQMQNPCSGAYNSVVLEEESKYLVYLIAASTEQNVVPIGGHYRFTFDKKDINSFTKERLSNSCLTLEKPSNAVGLAVSHLVTDGPLETHVFLGMLYGTLAIVTESGTFLTANGQIELVDDLSVE